MPTTQNIEPGKTAEPRPPVERLVPNPKAKLRDQFHEVCRFKRLAERTEEAYWGWVRRFLVFCKEGGAWRHPRELGGAEACRFLSHLATARNVSASTQNQALNLKPGAGWPKETQKAEKKELGMEASFTRRVNWDLCASPSCFSSSFVSFGSTASFRLNALVFFYRETLGIRLVGLNETARARRPARLPVVLTREEVRRLLDAVPVEVQLPLRLGEGGEVADCRWRIGARGGGEAKELGMGLAHACLILNLG